MTPGATYRLQFREGMTFEMAARLVPYLADLGISHLYASPIFAARSGSTHGYDVVDHRRLDPQLGGESGFAVLREALARHRLGLILDIVPNHMATSIENPWWADVLSWGRDSCYAGHFDIDWSASKLLLPVLGEPYGEALEAGLLEIRLDATAGTLKLGYYDNGWPLTPASYHPVLEGVAGLDAIAAGFRDATPDGTGELHARFSAALDDDDLRAALEKRIETLNSDRDGLHRIHEFQIWRLAHWRLAREALTHRRFFEISDLIGVRVEDPAVFDDVHRLITALSKAGTVDGLRIDHIDGLADPKAYLARLRAATGTTYVVVEKILSGDEELRSDWETAGTSGYEIARLITGLQVDRSQADAMTEGWTGFTGDDPDFARQVVGIKRRILTVNLAGELDALVSRALKIARADLATRDFGQDALRRAIVEIAVALPVYRTYVDADGPSPDDRSLIEAAVAAANRGRQIEDEREPDFIGALLLREGPRSEDAEFFVRRFQQTTGALTAKAVEDTSFYRFNRLVALNEVGSEPETFGVDPEAFHIEMEQRAKCWPQALSSTATHDTKRGEDARARLAVLSEMPHAWAAALRRWHIASRGLREELPLGPAPGPGAEWLFYQALAGAWPADLRPDSAGEIADLADRLDDFMTKALREAKRRTSWTDQNADFEAAVSRYVRGVLSPLHADLLADIADTLRPVMMAGFVNSLAQVALKLTVPGVPDIYQGTELLDLSLVDPDNRRPVDFALRESLLAEAREVPAASTLPRWREGMPKLWLTSRLLDLRRRRPALFAHGSYKALPVEGEGANHIVAFARQHGEETVAVIVPRLVLSRMRATDPPALDPELFATTRIRLPGHTFRALDDTIIPADSDGAVASQLLGTFPVAILERADSDARPAPG